MRHKHVHGLKNGHQLYMPAATYTDFPPRDNNCIITLSALLLSLNSFPSWCIKECFVLWMNHPLLISAFLHLSEIMFRSAGQKGKRAKNKGIPDCLNNSIELKWKHGVMFVLLQVAVLTGNVWAIRSWRAVHNEFSCELCHVIWGRFSVSTEIKCGVVWARGYETFGSPLF